MFLEWSFCVPFLKVLCAPSSFVFGAGVDVVFRYVYTVRTDIYNRLPVRIFSSVFTHALFFYVRCLREGLGTVVLFDQNLSMPRLRYTGFILFIQYPVQV